MANFVLYKELYMNSVFCLFQKMERCHRMHFIDDVETTDV